MLAHQGMNALETEYTTNINKILKKILRSRPTKDKQENNDDDEDTEDDEDIDILPDSNKKRMINLNDLSSSLISSCASYFGGVRINQFD